MTRRPELTAAILNGALIMLAPAILVANTMYTATVVRPSPPTLLSSAAGGVVVMLAFAPVALLVGYRGTLSSRPRVHRGLCRPDVPRGPRDRPHPRGRGHRRHSSSRDLRV